MVETLRSREIEYLDLLDGRMNYKPAGLRPCHKTNTIMIFTRAKNGFAAQMQQKCLDVMRGCNSAAAPRLTNREMDEIRDYAGKIINILARH